MKWEGILNSFYHCIDSQEPLLQSISLVRKGKYVEIEQKSDCCYGKPNMTKYRPVLLAACSYSNAFSGQTAASISRCNGDLQQRVGDFTDI